MKNTISYGNLKLPKSTAIFNLGSATQCPSAALGLCNISAGKCYALKAERQYTAVLPYRERQANYWLATDAETFVTDFLSTVSRKRTPVTHLRINEAGDLYGQSCVTKLDRIAELLAPHGVIVYGYTARRDLDYSSVEHMVLNGSGFMITNQFTAVPEFTGDNLECPGDCRHCTLCSTPGHRNIEVLDH